MRGFVSYAAVCFAALPLLLIAEDKADLFAVNRIKTEAFENSKVMDHVFYLTDVNGPRLAGSPGFQKAADWAVKRLKEYGLSNVNEEPWGPFGRGWANTHFEANLLEPSYSPLIGIPLAWSESTNGPVTGEPVMAIIREEGDFDKYRGKLAGKIVLTDAPRELKFSTTPTGRRYTDAELNQEAEAPGVLGPRRPAGAFERRFREKLNAFMTGEHVAVWVRTGSGEAGTVTATSLGPYESTKPLAVPAVALAPEHYNRIARLLEHKLPVRLEFNLRNEIYNAPESVNVIAEIPGGSKKDEIVMLGAHLDSWHGATGATDNASGVAVVMEAARILNATGMKMERTVRLALWGGEEEGMLGSKAYVKKHFADPEVMKPTAEHAKLDAYFNYDNGTGRIRGIYLQGNDMVRPIFTAWLAPFQDLGATAVSIRNTGSTDHVSFDAVGLPGFQFIQDPMDYFSRTHHTNMDVYDRIQPNDLMQASAIMASFVYHTAVRAEMLPRKPLPKPAPKREEKPEQAEPGRVSTSG